MHDSFSLGTPNDFYDATIYKLMPFIPGRAGKVKEQWFLFILTNKKKKDQHCMLDVLEQRRLSGPSVVKRFPGGSGVPTKDSLTCSRYELLGLFAFED